MTNYFHFQISYNHQQDVTVINTMNKNMRKTYLVFVFYSIGAFLLLLSIFTFSISSPANDPLNIVTNTVVPRNSIFCVDVVHIGKNLASMVLLGLFVSLLSFIYNITWSCLNFQLFVENGKICVKDPKDDSKISKPFVDGYGWDVDISMRVQQVMRRHPDAVFLGNR